MQIYAKNSTRMQISISYAIDITKIKQYKWAAVVIRNLPPNISSEQVAKRCQDEHEKLKYVLPPMQVKCIVIIEGQNCTIAVMDDLEDAERVCHRLNMQKISEKQVLKVWVITRRPFIHNVHQ